MPGIERKSALNAAQKTVMKRKVTSLKTVMTDISAMEIDDDAEHSRRTQSILRRTYHMLERITDDLESMT